MRKSVIVMAVIAIVLFYASVYAEATQPCLECEAAYQRGVEDTLNALRLFCMEDSAFVLGSNDGEEEEYLCVRKGGSTV